MKKNSIFPVVNLGYFPEFYKKEIQNILGDDYFLVIQKNYIGDYLMEASRGFLFSITVVHKATGLTSSARVPSFGTSLSSHLALVCKNTINKDFHLGIPLSDNLIEENREWEKYKERVVLVDTPDSDYERIYQLKNYKGLFGYQHMMAEAGAERKPLEEMLLDLKTFCETGIVPAAFFWNEHKEYMEKYGDVDLRPYIPAFSFRKRKMS
jgi:hypothetical protein